MAFYDLSKDERAALSATIKKNLSNALSSSLVAGIIGYFSDEDTYIRKAAYLAIGRIYFEQAYLQASIINSLNTLLEKEDFKIRQTVINAAGEIGKQDFDSVQHFFDKGLFDAHHSPRNAVIGSIKKMGEVNPESVLAWTKNTCITMIKK
ncbi:HEAT repeat domain-containing protein [Niabella hibiscisoli]|uniref:HEAT repeat domain-containing protein n=1 Tax=Niabella hibiscisoli TaxID=1825928 RepID=UPI001F105D04|nr:HEAT repeat domain-containing protein [Niabella hibiscisoli]MCH5715618.1 HEAT repeat domain-containing protein [Niabella hibiscisoli]